MCSLGQVVCASINSKKVDFVLLIMSYHVDGDVDDNVELDMRVVFGRSSLL